MRIFVDLSSDKITPGLGQSAETTQLFFKRSLTARLEIQFTRNGIVEELPLNSTGIFGMKTQGKYDADYIVADLAWVKSGTGESTVYTFGFSFVNTELDDQFNVDVDLTNDVAVVTLMAELEWIVDGFRHKSQTLQVIIANDVNRGGESIPQLPRLAHGVYLPDVNRLVGGTPTDLDGFPTASLADGYIVEVLILSGGVWRWLPYVLRPGSGGVVPVDYNAMTNNRHWEGASSSAPGPLTAVDINATMDLPALCLVTAGGQVANSNDLAHFNHVVGILMSSIATGNVATVVVEGEVDDVSWSWGSNLKLFLNGTSLSVTPPSSGFSQMVGITRNSTGIFVRLQIPIRL